MVLEVLELRLGLKKDYENNDVFSEVFLTETNFFISERILLNSILLKISKNV